MSAQPTTLRISGGRVIVVCRHAPVVKVFRVTGLDQVFPLHSALDDVVHPLTQRADDGSR